MKRRIIVLGIVVFVAIAGVLLYFFVFHKNGDVKNVKTSISSTKRHSQKDIETAMDIAKEYFKQEFSGCTLTDLWYDDKISANSEKGWLEQYKGVDAIVLLSNYKVDSSGGDGSLEPNSTQSAWQWIIVKNFEGHWKLVTNGYG